MRAVARNINGLAYRRVQLSLDVHGDNFVPVAERAGFPSTIFLLIATVAAPAKILPAVTEKI